MAAPTSPSSAITHHPDRLIFYAFDLLAFEGRGLRPMALMERRTDLQQIVGDPDPGCPIHFSTHVIGNGAAMFEAADALGLEGIGVDPDAVGKADERERKLLYGRRGV
jgi:ATP-dependent DNA ligase